ncbi:putative disease resistance protein rga3 [Quercus suber]|uniref:Disease resistance protein rga3 n=1 Tax=Quercus suber TaxID=58331 RepID=A0AAW0MAE0_QUESU
MAKKIKAVQEKLAEVNGLANGLANGFGLARILSVDSNVEIVPTRETDSFLDHSEVVGRKNDVRRLRTFVSKNVVLGNTLLNFNCLRVLKLNGNSIKELPSSVGLLIHLRLLSVASLSIRALPKSITKLYNLQTLRIEGCRNVLEGLKPHRYLKSLAIDDFGGKKFPSWMLTSLDAWDGILLFGNLIEIRFGNCRKCEVLPTLGLLPHLRKLHIRDMCSTTFENIISKLTTLTSLEVWNISGLACLPEKLLQNNASLMSLTIGGWADLESIVSHEDVWAFCTSLRSLKIKVCWKLQIQGVPSHLQRLEINGCVILPTGLQSCTSLTLLEIQRCDKLKSIPNLGQLHSLTQLKIRYCDNLISIPDLRGLHSLIELQICHCPKLTSLPEGLESLTRLKTLAIGKFCKELDDFPSLVSIEHLHASLQHLELRGWPKLKSIPDNIQVFTALKSLFISHFEGMETWPEWLTKLSSLQILEIFRCSKLKECCAIGGKERYKIAHIPDIRIY